MAPKLAIGSVSDPLEQEADHIADEITRSPQPSAGASPAHAAPQGAAVAVQRKCTACEGDESSPIQRKDAPGATPAVSDAPSIVQTALRTGGVPLGTPTRAFFEPRLGVDLSTVRVHTGAAASESARAIEAHAYTAGRDIVFGEGRYSPETTEGRLLLAHELVHVAQHASPKGPWLRRKAIKDVPLGRKLVSVKLKQISKPVIARQKGNQDTINLLITQPLDIEATAQFASGADAAGLTFGFFQLGRPYELYRATMRKSGADPSEANADLNLDLTTKLRQSLPLPDHSPGQRFYASPRTAQTAAADPTGKVTVRYSDFPSTPFATSIQKGGTFYDLSGIAAQTFFFTAFGAWDGTDAIILSTFYWDIKHCEQIAPADVLSSKAFGPVNVAPFRSCATGGCDLGEPGADQFGQPAGASFVDWFASVVLRSLLNPGAYDGPANFAVGCQQTPRKKQERGQND